MSLQIQYLPKLNLQHVNNSFEIIFFKDLSPVSYTEALHYQNELNNSGKSGWIIFNPKSVITVGKRFHSNYDSQLKSNKEDILKNNCEIINVSRGGILTYHGPGQMVLFPFGKLSNHIGDTRGVKNFIKNTISKLMNFIEIESNEHREICHDLQGEFTGIWTKNIETNKFQKIVSVGLAIHRTGFEHGFSINLYPALNGTFWGYDQIIACGNEDVTTGYVYNNENSFEQISFKNSLLKYLK